MPDQQIDFSEILVSPISSMIQKIASGIAEAQKNLDAAALESQNNLKNNYPALADIGYQVTWYHMPEINVELKVAVHYEEKGEGANKKTGIFLAPFNAKYKNSYSYNADGSSILKMKIVPLPPPLKQNV